LSKVNEGGVEVVESRRVSDILATVAMIVNVKIVDFELSVPV
jgi:3-dehydroquinate dehydratase